LAKRCGQGCQIFHGTTYQNVKIATYIQNGQNIYRMNLKYSK
jgi:hypothetical protein